MNINPGDAVAAISGLGTASFGLVDASKSLLGGASNFGFGQIGRLVDSLAPARTGDELSGSALSNAAIRATLRANWLNGTALGDQKSIAKTLFKLLLDSKTAPGLAAKTGVDADMLARVAQKYVSGAALLPEEQNVAARFDLLLSTLLDQAYQRADQIYRNGAKVSAVFVSIGLAVAGNYAMGSDAVPPGVAIMAGALAAPLAPVSKDLASALQAAVKTLQFFRK